MIDNFAHFNLITERTLKTNSLGILVRGPSNTGKTSFCKIYKALHHEETAHLFIHVGKRNKSDLYEKLMKVFSIKSTSSIGPKLNYSQGLVIIDDLHLPPTIAEDEKN